MIFFNGGGFNNVIYSSLICIDKNTRCKSMLQNLSTSGWNSLWSNVSWIGEWCIRNIDKYYKGDFDGDGKDELFCVQTTNGDSDWMTLLRYNSSWQRCWSNDGVSYGIGIYPYRNKLIVGNFDADVNDEILGIHTWATKFDFNLSMQDWHWSWSTNSEAYLSDWHVNKDYNLFFLKTFTNVPDFLFIYRMFPDTYSFNGYSFDPN